MDVCKKKIETFSSKRPEAVGVYGYGSGVFKQKSYEGKPSPMTDVIFVVDDMAKWHDDNKKLNPDDYSFLGSVFVFYNGLAKIKGRNNVTYFGEIRDEGNLYKYGVIEVDDFVKSLSTWDNMFMAGRFHKPVLRVKTRYDLDRSIDRNRMAALRVACLISGQVATKKDLLTILCGISYIGDVRMRIAENPRKVENIVEGSYQILDYIYSMNQNFLYPLNDNTFIISHETLLKEIDKLPEFLLGYLKSKGIDLENYEMVVKYVVQYINERNFEESRAQIIEGFKTNGIARSVPYVKEKILKKINYK